MLKKTDIEPLVIEAIRELIKNQDFATEVKSKIGKQIDTSTLDRELKNYETKLREVDLNKTRLENEIDSLPEETRFRERKLHDMTLRLDGLYDTIVELEEKIEDVKLRRKAVEQDAITLENIYILLANFDKVFDKISDEEKKSLISSLIKEIEIFPCDESELPLKSILFNFPVYKDGGDVCGFLWDKSTHVSTWLELMELISFEFVRARKHIHCIFGTIGRREHINRCLVFFEALLILFLKLFRIDVKNPYFQQQLVCFLQLFYKYKINYR